MPSPGSKTSRRASRRLTLGPRVTGCWGESASASLGELEARRIVLMFLGREEEKRMLAGLNEKHLEMMEEKQRKISGLQGKLDILGKYKEVFVEEDRKELEKTVSFLEQRVEEVERRRREEAGAARDCQVSLLPAPLLPSPSLPHRWS